MATLALWLALQEPRVSLEVQDEPLGVAAVLALAPFGDEVRWPAPPLALRRVSFRLKDAGYLEALDTLGLAGGYGRVLHPDHTLLLGPPNECVTFSAGDPPLAAVDLSPSVRLLTWASATQEDASLTLYVIAPPTTPRRNARLEGRVSGQALRIDFDLLGGRAGDPVRLHAHAKLPRPNGGRTFTLEGVLRLDDGRAFPVAIGPLPRPPLPVAPEPPAASPPPGPWALLFGGLTLVVGGIYLALRRRRVRI